MLRAVPSDPIKCADAHRDQPRSFPLQQVTPQNCASAVAKEPQGPQPGSIRPVCRLASYRSLSRTRFGLDSGTDGPSQPDAGAGGRVKRRIARRRRPLPVRGRIHLRQLPSDRGDNAFTGRRGIGGRSHRVRSTHRRLLPPLRGVVRHGAANSFGACNAFVCASPGSHDTG